MGYLVKEIVYTLQGEGFHSGRPAVFCRFSGCNLWSGREEERKTSVCQFCDTDFVGINGPGGGKFGSAGDLTNAVAAAWTDIPGNNVKPFVVCTGGEPLLQLDKSLLEAFHQAGFEVAIETNGTLPAPEGIDWICVSPKMGTELILNSGNELKLVFPQHSFPPAAYENLNFKHFYLQPMDGEKVVQNTELAMRYCLEHPRWKLSLQIHKKLGIP